MNAAEACQHARLIETAPSRDAHNGDASPCLHVQLSFPAEMRGKYLKWRFSHTNPRCCGFMPKDRRDALWAEIKGNSSNRVSDRETAVEIPMPGAKAEDKKEVI